MQYPDGIVFGNGEHLPGLEVLDDFEFKQPYLCAHTNEVAAPPSYPECVVRREYAARSDRAEYYKLAIQAVDHFKQLEDVGLELPAQRLIVGEFRGRMNLYAITEKLEGTRLRPKLEYREQTAPAIDGLARYLATMLHDKGVVTDYLEDLCCFNQFTVQSTGRVVLHDVGIEFSGSRNGSHAMDSHFCTNLHRLNSWAELISLEPPDSLRQVSKRAYEINPSLYSR